MEYKPDTSELEEQGTGGEEEEEEEDWAAEKGSGGEGEGEGEEEFTAPGERRKGGPSKSHGGGSLSVKKTNLDITVPLSYKQYQRSVREMLDGLYSRERGVGEEGGGGGGGGGGMAVGEIDCRPGASDWARLEEGCVLLERSDSSLHGQERASE